MINERLFGAPIPANVRKKLEDRQAVAGNVAPGESIQAVDGQPAYTAEELTVAAEELKSQAIIREESDQDAAIRQSFDVVLDRFNTLIDEGTVDRAESNAPFQESLTAFETQVEAKYPGISRSQKVTVQYLLGVLQKKVLQMA